MLGILTECSNGRGVVKARIVRVCTPLNRPPVADLALAIHVSPNLTCSPSALGDGTRGQRRAQQCVGQRSRNLRLDRC